MLLHIFGQINTIKFFYLFFNFFKTGLFAVGGGLATIPFLSEEVIDTLSAIDWQSKLGDIMNVVSSGVGNVMNMVISTVSSVFSAIVTGFMALIFSIYLLIGRDRLQSQCKRLMAHYLPKRFYERSIYVLDVLNNAFRRYITGQCIEAVILGALCALGMLILRLPYATMIGALIAFTALIPVAGAYIGAAVGAFMILMVSPMQALVFLIFLVILQVHAVEVYFHFHLFAHFKSLCHALWNIPFLVQE